MYCCARSSRAGCATRSIGLKRSKLLTAATTVSAVFGVWWSWFGSCVRRGTYVETLTRAFQFEAEAGPAPKTQQPTAAVASYQVYITTYIRV